MDLRSSAATAQRVEVNSFIELRSDDPAAKPWLARVVQTKCSASGDLEEVECEWLWHPKESIRDFGLEGGMEGTSYGSREVFLGTATGESDWNPVASIKWVVYVFPLEVYKTVSANGYQMPAPTTKSESRHTTKSVVLEPNRCWYYRQSLNPETHQVTPKLTPTVHRPNRAFHQWCLANNHSLHTPTALDTPTDATNPPPRTILVPENPERIYYACTCCSRRFETKLGDCCDPAIVNDPKHFRLKIHIGSPDVEFVCPLCERMTGSVREESPPATKRARASTADQRITRSQSASMSGETSFVETEREDEARREEKKKQTRYERFNDVFKRAIDESSFDSTQSSLLQYYDPKVGEVAYSSESRLNAKMAHQQLHEIFQNLKRENNIDLRRRIVTGELSLHDLVRSSAKDLAPESLRKRREAEAKKYFTQQVLLQSNVSASQLIRKTHKGLEAVAAEEDTISRSPIASRSPSPERQGPSGFPTGVSVMLRQSDDQNTDTKSLTDIDIGHFLEAKLQSRRNSSITDCKLLDTEFFLKEKWEAARPLLSKDAQIIAPIGGPSGIPKKSETLAYLKFKLLDVKAHEKLIVDLNKYCSISNSN